jgi:hypothetical protein
MMAGAGAAVTLTQLFHVERGAAVLENQDKVSDYTVIVYQENDSVIAKDTKGNTIRSGLLHSDSSKVIQAGIDFININGGGVLHIKTGVYNLNTLISIASLSNIIIEGEGRDATILRANVADIYIMYKDNETVTKNVLIRDMTIDGNNISSFLINLNGNSYDYILENIVFMRGKTYGPQCFLVNCYNLTVRKCVFKDPASDGDLVAIEGWRITVEDCLFTRTITSGGGLTSGGLQESKIVNCSWHDYNGYGAISLENFEFFDNVLIMGNSFKDCSKDGSAILTVVDSTPSGVSPGHTHNRIAIIANHLMNIGGAIELRQKTSNVIIQGNIIEDTRGISISAPTNCIISNNIIRNTNQDFPIMIYGTDGSNVMIQDNVIENSVQSAITLSATHNFHIKDNMIINPFTVSDNTDNGVHIQSFNGVNSDYGKVVGNTVISTSTNKPKYSIYVEGNYIEIKDNKVKGYYQGGIGKGNGTGITIGENQTL